MPRASNRNILKRVHPPDFQISLPGLSHLDDAIATLSQGGVETRGAIFTRREVVDFILDLVGYRPELRLFEQRLLEPSFGDGDFLFPALDRLFASYEAAGRPAPAVTVLRDAVRGVELHRATFERTHMALLTYLAERGLSEAERHALGGAWLRHGDFLLEDLPAKFTHIVGNPPYVRQELIPDDLMAEYRRRYATIFDRADLYVPFIERALQLLGKDGAVAFICADRWMKNRYGGPLRHLVASEFHLRTYVDMVDTPAFHSEVIAYPAIFVIGREHSPVTRLAHRPAVEAASLRDLARALNGEISHAGVSEVMGVASTDRPWILESLDQLAIVRRLEAALPALEEAGCKVGIGVATGADQVFIAPLDELDVEHERKLPLVMARDIESGHIDWGGKGVINPFGKDGKLVRLADYPKFKRYIEKHGADIRKRHVSQKNPENWYRTIDRIYPELTHTPKLLIPDIKGEANVVYDEGHYYPHHNLYHVTSDSWDLQALRTVLRSPVAHLFVETYSTKMRGGYLRFQAQYLRRIRLPRWESVPAAMRKNLRAASQKGAADATALVFDLYGLSAEERALLGSVG